MKTLDVSSGTRGGRRGCCTSFGHSRPAADLAAGGETQTKGKSRFLVRSFCRLGRAVNSKCRSFKNNRVRVTLVVIAEIHAAKPDAFLAYRGLKSVGFAKSKLTLNNFKLRFAFDILSPFHLLHSTQSTKTGNQVSIKSVIFL